MHRRTKQASVGQLAEVKQGFDRWRRGRKRRGGRIPERLWRMAAEAASVHGVDAAARELGLNPTRLRERLDSFGQSRASEETVGFVELPWMGAVSLPECILEAEDQVGRKLRVHLKGSATSQAAAFGRMLWGSQQ